MTLLVKSWWKERLKKCITFSKCRCLVRQCSELYLKYNCFQDWRLYWCSFKLFQDLLTHLNRELKVPHLQNYFLGKVLNLASPRYPISTPFVTWTSNFVKAIHGSEIPFKDFRYHMFSNIIHCNAVIEGEHVSQISLVSQIEICVHNVDSGDSGIIAETAIVAQ